MLGVGDVLIASSCLKAGARTRLSATDAQWVAVSDDVAIGPDEGVRECHSTHRERIKWMPKQPIKFRASFGSGHTVCFSRNKLTVALSRVTPLWLFPLPRPERGVGGRN